MSDSHSRKHKKRTAPAITSLDEDEHDGAATTSDSDLVHHRFSIGGLPTDLTIVLDSFPQHRFEVHKQVMALNSTYFSTLIPHLDASNTTHIPAGSPRASVGAMLLILHMIYNESQYIERQSSNRYLRAGDTIHEQRNDWHDEITVQCVKVESVRGGLEENEVKVTCDMSMTGRDCEFTYSKMKYDVHLHQPVNALRPSTPLPRLTQMTTVEHLLPLTAFFDSQSLLWPIEEHLITTAYYGGLDQRVYHAQLAAQYKLERAFGRR